MTSAPPIPVGNRLLASLSPADRERLEPDLERVPLPLSMILMQPHAPIDYLYFLDSGLASDVAMTGGERSVECGLVGIEGFVGVPVVLGTDRGIHESLMQIGGFGRRIAADAVRRAIDSSALLRRALLNYAHIFMSQAAQSAACNARHAIEERLARWLLMVHDRMPDDRVPLTHEYLAMMLGVRRAGVTVALHQLEGEGLVRGGRGSIRVLDRAGLERRSCRCYRLVRDETERVLGGQSAAPTNAAVSRLAPV